MVRTMIAVLFLIAGLLAEAKAHAQAPAAGTASAADQSPDVAAARLALMKRTLLLYHVHSISDPPATYRLLPDPIFRFTNPVGGSKDGAIFFWLGEQDRPEVAVQIFLRRDDKWVEEFSSLSPGRLVAESPQFGPAWTPARGGVEFQQVPDAPRPGETAEQRLRQMRALSQDFAAEDNFQGKSWQSLRLLSRPLARYGKPGTEVLDGALYSFALGTDPEAFLMLEARTGKAGPEWQFGFAPMTTYELKASWKGKEVWSAPWRKTKDRGLNQTFHVRYDQAVE